MSDQAVASRGVVGHMAGWVKGAIGLMLGVGSGVVVMYSNAIVNQVVKPNRPLANFGVTTDGLTVTCKNQATGDSGWWDFGDGTTLDPFDAGQQAMTHTYAKPGNYSVKLTVRNFLMEENDRTVPVDLTTPPQTLPPSITGLTVEPINGQAVAPAGFRISGEVKNAEHIVYDFGDDKPLTVDTKNGKFEKYAVLQNPGNYTIRVTGVTATSALKQEAKVNVSAPQAGSVSVVLKVTDTGTVTRRQAVPQTVAVALPKKPEAKFEKAFTAAPGYTITEATLGKFNAAAVKGVKAELAADRKGGKIVGEWAATGEALTKAAAGLDVLIPLTVTQELVVPFRSAPQEVTAVLAGGTQVTTVALPPRRADVQNPQRKIEMRVVRAMPNGTQDLLVNEAELKLPWTSATVTRPGVNYGFGAALNGDTLQLRMQSVR